MKNLTFLAVFFKIGLICLVTVSSVDFPPNLENIELEVCIVLLPTPVIRILTLSVLFVEESSSLSSNSIVSLEFLANLLKISDFSLAASLSEYTKNNKNIYIIEYY